MQVTRSARSTGSCTSSKTHALCAIVLAVVLGAASAATTPGAARADAPNAPGPAAATHDTGRPSVLNWIAAAALTAVTGMAVTSSVYTAVRSGDCVGETEPATGRCTERIDFGWRSAVFLSIGLTSLVAATFFAVLQPIRARISVAPTHAALDLELSF